MFLGIEIGGTKLQLGVGRGESTELAEMVRLDVDRAKGARGILDQIVTVAPALIERHQVNRIGVGFGGPVDAARGVIVKSHQVEGWDGFALVEWCRGKFTLPTALGNDSDLAALAEARLGAGKGKSPVMYVNVGTGIGGGLVIEGELYRGNGAGAMEIGHLLLPAHQLPDKCVTVESLASGPAIEHRTFANVAPQIRDLPTSARERRDKMDLCQLHMHRDSDAAKRYLAILIADGMRPNAELAFRAAAEGNCIARAAVHGAIAVLGWAIAQAVTLLSPAVVVIGGGVSLAGEDFFFKPLREAVRDFAFPPFAGTFEIVPAALGEAMVVHGALILAAKHAPS